LRVLEAAPLTVHPALELGCVPEKHAVEKGPRVQSRRRLEIVRGYVLFELYHVTGEDVAIHAELCRAEQQIVDRQLAPQQRHHLTERISRVFRFALGPKERNDRVAAQPAASVDGQQGEQGERTTVRHRSARHGVLDRKPAERSESEHPGDAWNKSPW